ncbi:MAG: hypothetical protein U9P10_12030, partial [Thermodesulfobacteriota bacterium]|nr:hypothetical protein [Thermodesulfobacteriota bacterium]
MVVNDISVPFRTELPALSVTFAVIETELLPSAVMVEVLDESKIEAVDLSSPELPEEPHPTVHNIRTVDRISNGLRGIGFNCI